MDRELARLAAGEVATVAVDHGRPWTGPSGVEVHGDGRDRPTLSGTVRWVPYAAEADMLVVVATDGDEQQLHLVDPSADGCTTEAHDHVDPLARFATVHLDGASRRRRSAPSSAAR